MQKILIDGTLFYMDEKFIQLSSPVHKRQRKLSKKHKSVIANSTKTYSRLPLYVHHVKPVHSERKFLANSIAKKYVHIIP